MSEIFDWANMPPVEPLAEPQVKSKLLSKLDDVALIGSLAILGISAYGFFNYSPEVPPKVGCPELPENGQLAQTAKNIAEAPTTSELFWKKASAAGLHFGPYEEADKLSKTILSSPTPERATRLANYYTLSNFGFTTTLDRKVKVPNKKFVEFKQDLSDFVQDSSLLPIQIVKGSVSSLYISDELPNKQEKETHYSVAGLFDDETRMVSTRPYQVSYAFTHELGHGLDRRVCGSNTDLDPAYTKQNPKGFQYDSTRHDKKTSNVAADGYGEVASYEDKATLFEEFLDYGKPDSSEGINLNQLVFEQKTERQKVLLSKLVIFLDRIEKLAPGSASYLSSISRWRHQEQGPDQDFALRNKAIEVHINR